MIRRTLLAAALCCVATPSNAKDNNIFAGIRSIEITMEKVETCTASQYGIGDGYHGKRTASGQTFNTHALTAAHKTRKFGSTVLVTNIANGRAVTVRINDRGPFIKGRCIDLSNAAARAIGMGGLAEVTVE